MRIRCPAGGSTSIWRRKSKRIHPQEPCRGSSSLRPPLQDRVSARSARSVHSTENSSRGARNARTNSATRRSLGSVEAGVSAHLTLTNMPHTSKGDLHAAPTSLSPTDGRTGKARPPMRSRKGRPARRLSLFVFEDPGDGENCGWRSGSVVCATASSREFAFPPVGGARPPGPRTATSSKNSHRAPIRFRLDSESPDTENLSSKGLS